jgi:polyisoprenoid-binding protein YceI
MKTVIVIVFALIVVIGGYAAYSVLRTPAEASSPIEAIPLEVTTDTETAAVTETESTAVAETAVEETAATGEPTVYAINTAASQARFELDEDLRGNRITVVGNTDQIAGELAFDFNDLSQTQIGTILINARTLATDNDFRNRAIQNEILDTGDYEYITFTPTAINGLPESAAIGDTITFTIDGDLTIRDVTTPVTFSVEATAASDSQIIGTASTIITRDAYGLTIPSVPSVANVEQEVELYIDFAANAG